MIEAVPAYIDPVDFIGDGPSTGIGNSPSDPTWVSREMVSGPPSIIWPVAPAMPYAEHMVELARIPRYPGEAYDDQHRIVQPPQAPSASLDYPAQDDITPMTNYGLDLVLGAPVLPTGDSNF